MTIPQFNKYSTIGDKISFDVDGFTIVAKVEYDSDTSPENYIEGGMDAEEITSWEREEWHFAGLVLSIAKNGIVLSDHAASLWGLPVNLDESSLYLNQVVTELLPEALAEGRRVLKLLCEGCNHVRSL